MALNRIRLGDFLKVYKAKCNNPNLKCSDVSGVNKEKEFFEPSKQVSNDTSNYKVVPPYYFACNLMHIGRDEVLPIAINRTNKNKIVTPAYSVFSLKNEDVVLKDYLFMYLNSSEKDRFFWFHCDSSVRDGMDWSVFCDIEIELPSIEIQQKYVDIYRGMVENQKAYERGLEDLKLVCDGYIEDLRRKIPSEPIGKHLVYSDMKNHIGLRIDNVKGISTGKEFIKTKADMDGVELSSYKIVPYNYFAYVADTSRRGDKISLALNQDKKDLLVSSISLVFTTNNDLMPEYLMMFFNRKEFDRYARFHSWGSARETFTWNDLIEVKIPIPNLEVQRSIVNIYKAYNARKAINEKLKNQIKDICPILIKGSLDEGKI